MLWRRARAKVLARRGEYADAEQLAREALDLSIATECRNWQGYALFDLAEVLEFAGERGAARAALERAVGLHEQKGNLVRAERARARLATCSEDVGLPQVSRGE
jgi:tetratricopeptide (TPR) repeat protein